MIVDNYNFYVHHKSTQFYNITRFASCLFVFYTFTSILEGPENISTPNPDVSPRLQVSNALHSKRDSQQRSHITGHAVTGRLSH